LTLRAYRRFEDHKAAGHPLVLPPDHKAIVNKTALFPTRVQEPHYTSRLLKSGQNSRKIGSHVTKGAWKGMPIYTLTLEERATCPTICEHWHDCFGNKMHWSTRWKAGPALERGIANEITALADRHRGGFVVRLHVLGDFYSRKYVKLWESLMIRHDELHVFGYTRYEKTSFQGRLINDMNNRFPERWVIRWSERGGELGTLTAQDVTLRGKTSDGIVCPAQTGDSDCCGTCALCWSTTAPIIFINH
jgi:hypothetical protein